MEQSNKIVLFQEKAIRRVWHNEAWWFVIEDVITALTDSANPKMYLKNMRRRDEELNKGWVQIGTTLSVDTEGGAQKMNCANTKGLFRLIMSMPSPKAEPFKLWLAQVGEERIQEIENPELGFDRLRSIYQTKGYPAEWIERRLQTIEIRKQLTDEWKNRDIKEGQEYSILTAEIAKATFGLTPSQHKQVKGLDKQNLRDHMTPLELIFTALSEEVTRTITVDEKAQGFEENYGAVQRGGRAAGKARLNIERETGKPVVSADNYLQQIKEAEKKGSLPDAGITDITEVTEG
jgi:DNA-damage-inducible protein D